MKLTKTHACLAATVATAAGVLAGLPSPALAAPPTVHVTGGYGQFNPDPSGSIPGDSIRACDTASDGWWIEARLDVGNDGDWDRIASTQGHLANYCTGWMTGNLAEGTEVRLRVIPTRSGDTGQWTEAKFEA